MNKTLKWILISIGVVLGAFVLYFVIGIISFMGIFSPSYNTEDLVKNYEAKSKQINHVKDYVNSITPKDTWVSLEFESNRTLGIFHVTNRDTNDHNWDLSISSSKTEFLLKKLGWTKETLTNIKEKLDDADCISVEKGEPFTVGYQRSGMGMYFYKIFEKPLTDSLKTKYNDGCMYMQYTNKVVLEYGSGAFGSMCIGDFKKLPKEQDVKK